MRKSKIDATLNNLILHDELTDDDKTNIIEIKKIFDCNDHLHDSILSNAQFITLFFNQCKKISRWLNLPEDLIKTKINDKNFNDVEISLIITNLMMEFFLTESEVEDDNN